ncbi:MAG: hypothetical protein V3U78_10675 [Thiotrichaceae bacterium]
MQYLLLSLSYVLPVALVVWLWFGKHLGTRSKLLLTLVLPLVYFLHWTGLQQSKGWPSDQTLPLRFELISADVLEPNPLKEIKGNIHLWVRPLEKEGGKTRTHTPRAYILPYSRALHKKLYETKQRTQQGRNQMGLLYDEASGGSGASLGNGRKLDFKDMPQQRLPPKL